MPAPARTAWPSPGSTARAKPRFIMEPLVKSIPRLSPNRPSESAAKTTRRPEKAKYHLLRPMMSITLVCQGGAGRPDAEHCGPLEQARPHQHTQERSAYGYG